MVVLQPATMAAAASRAAIPRAMSDSAARATPRKSEISGVGYAREVPAIYCSGQGFCNGPHNRRMALLPSTVESCWPRVRAGGAAPESAAGGLTPRSGRCATVVVTTLFAVGVGAGVAAITAPDWQQAERASVRVWAQADREHADYAVLHVIDTP